MIRQERNSIASAMPFLSFLPAVKYVGHFKNSDSDTIVGRYLLRKKFGKNSYIFLTNRTPGAMVYTTSESKSDDEDGSDGKSHREPGLVEARQTALKPSHPFRAEVPTAPASRALRAGCVSA